MAKSEFSTISQKKKAALYSVQTLLLVDWTERLHCYFFN